MEAIMNQENPIVSMDMAHLRTYTLQKISMKKLNGRKTETNV